MVMDINLSETHAEEFRERGFVVVDDFLDESWSLGLREECARLEEICAFSPHEFKFGTQLFGKPNIYEVDLHDRAKRSSKHLSELYDLVGPNIRSKASNLMPELQLDDRPSAIKLQYNSGGCFPWHYDNPGPPSRRQVTCIVYLNEGWKSGDGGELVLSPFLSPPVEIPPLMNRAVLFRSDVVLHRVLPSSKKRFCFSAWLDGSRVNKDEDVLLSKDMLRFSSYDGAEAFFRASPLQRVISRAVYSDEYEESLIECVGGTPGERSMLAHHEKSVGSIYAKLRPLVDEFRRRKIICSASKGVHAS